MSDADAMRNGSFSRVMVAGAGVLGRQIAFQTAFNGFPVALYDHSAAALEAAKPHLLALPPIYQAELGASPDELDATLARLSYHADLSEAVQGVELVIEAVSENLKIKQDFYAKLHAAAAPETIFASNSSTFVPSQLAETSGRPERYLHLHFANQIWTRCIAEIMPHPQTDPAVFDRVLAFARAIGMVPLPLHKEKSGYIINTLLVPWLDAAMELVVEGIADVQMVDKTWMIARQTANGPFGLMDIIGLNTVYEVNKNRYAREPTEYMARVIAFLERNFIAPGKLGRTTGEGFYTYPNPAYEHPDFLKG